LTSASSPSARPDLAETLVEAAGRLGVALSGKQRHQLLDYLALLERWNRTYNLTAVREPAGMLTQHVVDCLAAVPALRRTASDRKRVLDVGSGGGLPGIVWAVVEPERDITCVDSVGKKAAFIRQAALALGLGNVTAMHGRVEQLTRTAFDMATSRAFASLSDFVSLTDPLVAPTGLWLAMKGKLPLEEISHLPRRFDAFHVEHLDVPGLDAERCLIWVRRRTPVLANNESGRLQ